MGGSSYCGVLTTGNISVTMDTHSLAWVLAIMVLLFSSVSCSCKGKGKFAGQQICEGGVTKELKTLVKICTDGKLKFKPKSEVKPGYPLAGGECIWYGEVLCDGAVVEVSRQERLKLLPSSAQAGFSLSLDFPHTPPHQGTLGT